MANSIVPKVGKKIKVVQAKAGMKVGEVFKITRVDNGAIYLSNHLMCQKLDPAFFKELSQ